MLQILVTLKTLGFKKIMVYNTSYREKGRYTKSDSWSLNSFSSGWGKLIKQNHKNITAEGCFDALWL